MKEAQPDFSFEKVSRDELVLVKQIHISSQETISSILIDLQKQPERLNTIVLKSLDNAYDFVVYEMRKSDGKRRNSEAAWFKPLFRWKRVGPEKTSGAAGRSAFMRRFLVKPDKQAKQEVLSKLSKLVETVFEAESDLKFAVIHESTDNPDELMLYEEWSRSRESFIQDEVPKPYRTAYRNETDHFIQKNYDLEWYSVTESAP